MTLVRDLRFGLRSWLRRPVLTAAAVVTLALGTGANTAIFSVIHAVMLRPLPYPDSDRLVQIWSVDPKPASGSLAVANKRALVSAHVERIRASASTIENVAWYRPWMVNLATAQEPARLYAALVSASYFPTIGVAPALGRAISEAETVPGNDRVVILSDELWRAQFHGDRGVLGQSVTIDGNPYRVIGVMPPGFRAYAASLREQPDLYAPISMLYAGPLRQAGVSTIARLKPGVSARAANEEVGALYDRMQREGPAAPKIFGANVVPLADEVASNVRGALLTLLGAAGCVLLIACANLANLTLASTAARQKELGLRTALGAPRSRLVRQLLTESAALALAGGVAGAIVSPWIVRAIAILYPGNVPRFSEIRPDPAVFAFTLAITVITAILFGVLPALRFSRVDLNDALKGADALNPSRGSFLRGALVSAQVAIALVLLVGAGLLLRSFLLMRAIDPGYEVHNLLTAHLVLPEKLYSSNAQRIAFADQLVDRLNAIPNVESAAITNSLPLSFNFLMSIEVGIEGRPELGDKVGVDARAVSPRYFQTMAIRLASGRYLEPADSAGGAVVVNRSFAREYFPAVDPVGRSLTYGRRVLPIVGVIDDIRDLKLTRTARSVVYVPFASLPTNFMDLAVRTRSAPAPVVAAIRTELRQVDPNQPLGKVETMEQVFDSQVASPRFNAVLLGSFAALALLLAGVGIYGVIAYSVSLRTREIGIRMAIGADRAAVLAYVLRGGLLPPLIGLVIGIPAAMGVSRLLTASLYETRALDPLTYVLVAGAILLTSSLAALFPARRATRVDPMLALRCD
jgi:putative ABC transport system permease protein